jgi:uncharacterized protein DUF748
MSTQTGSLEKLLGDQLQSARTREPAAAAWIDRTFTPAVVAALVGACDEKSSAIELKPGKEGGYSVVVPPLFVRVAILAEPREKARERFAKKGRYKSLVNAAANSWRYKDSRAAAFCLLVNGRAPEGEWLEMTLFPLSKKDKAVPAVLPAGLLTPDEEKRSRKVIAVTQKKARAIKFPPPLSWIRLKVVAAFAVIIGALYFLGLNPLAKHQINHLGAGGQAGAHFSIAEVALGLLEGRSSFDAFKLATPKAASAEEEKERVASADQIVADLGMDDLLRKRFAVDEVSITKPLLRLERRADGTINVGEIGQKGPEPTTGKPTDWVGTIKDWAEKLRKREEERRKKAEEEKKKPPVAKSTGVRADYTEKVTYPYENLPGAVVRKLKAQALEIRFDDQTGSMKPPPIKNGTIEITNLSSRPEVMADPINLSISGEVEGGGKIEITSVIDLRKLTEGGLVTEKNLMQFNVKGTGLPLQKVVQAFAGDSLNATFDKGTVDLNAEVRLDHLDALLVHSPTAGSPLFSLHDVQMTAKPGSKIAGLDGAQFAQAVNEVGDLDFTDLEIGGTLLKPEFKWGDSIKELVTSGGKAFAKKQAQKGLEKGNEEAQKLIDKQLKNQSPETKKAVEDAKKKVGGLLEGAGGSLFGPKQPAPAPPPPPPEKK